MNSGLDQLSRRLLELDTELNSYPGDALFISDIHGEAERFVTAMRNMYGLLYQSCLEALSDEHFSEEQVRFLAGVVNKKAYIKDDNVDMDILEVIHGLVLVLKHKLNNRNIKLADIAPPEFEDVIRRLIHNLPVSELVFDEQIIADRLVFHLAQAIKQVLASRIFVLGDLFDRGPKPDKILRILSSKLYSGLVDYVFGNHDILWMGAAAGSRSLIAETMRISSRYDHMDLLDRLGFNVEKLVKFAVETYPVDKIKGKFKAKTNQAKSMEKALSVIQFKLEEKTIQNYPEFEMESRLWLRKFAEMLKTGELEGVNDTHFPTIDLDDPQKLSPEEEEVIDDLERQFKTNQKLKKLLRFFFEKGETYLVHNDILNIHALIPSTAEGEFQEFLGKKGKELLDHIHGSVRRIGEAYLSGQESNEKDLALMFYLWCGPKSPFFGKHAMKTFERYYFTDKKTHEEITLHWKKNLEKREFRQKIMDEFGVRRVVFGHTPVKYDKGQKMSQTTDGVAINIDGGFASAYQNRGHALVSTPHSLYGIILPKGKDVAKKSDKSVFVPEHIELIEKFPDPIKVKDTAAAASLEEQKDETYSQLQKLAKA